ncbi:hypothetical protein FGB62_4g323 [Gracilaria domingensis]|nr:hypothetical protein FGB62_4g323 [Gracilaria domingensis]
MTALYVKRFRETDGERSSSLRVRSAPCRSRLRDGNETAAGGTQRALPTAKHSRRAWRDADEGDAASDLWPGRCWWRRDGRQVGTGWGGREKRQSARGSRSGDVDMRGERGGDGAPDGVERVAERAGGREKRDGGGLKRFEGGRAPHGG